MADAVTHHDDHEHAAHPHVRYDLIFYALCFCTLLSIGVDYAKSALGLRLMIALVLGVATCKALFVLMYFMHLKFEGAWKYIILPPTMVLACAIPFTLAPDISFHYYEVQVPQLGEAAVYERQHQAGTHGVEDAGASGPTHGHEPSGALKGSDHPKPPGLEGPEKH